MTNSAGTGLILLVPFKGGGALPLLNEKGENYELLFSDIADQEIPNPAFNVPGAL